MERVAKAIKQDVIRFAKQAAAAGLMPNTQGNVSARDPQTGYIAITPHDYPYDVMTEDDIVIVDEHAHPVAGRLAPSGEASVHCAVYRARPDVHGIVHTEPIYTNCFGALGMAIEPVAVSLIVDLGGAVPVMPFMPSGSDEFGQRMLEVMGDKQGVVWGNHGLLTIGVTVEQAYRRTVIVESVAQIYHLCLTIGKPVVLKPEMLKAAIA
ncbi:MAG: class II aldolase/adducin family protein [Caldilineaceae bacterium]|nr:class II aldolase/adducin family protein [Caldilineaceae bacterium]